MATQICQFKAPLRHFNRVIERNWATAAVYGVTSRLTGIDYILNKSLNAL